MNEELELEKLNDLAIHYPVYLIDAAAEHFNGDECKLEAIAVVLSGLDALCMPSSALLFVQVLSRMMNLEVELPSELMDDAKQCGTKVSINDEKTIGILLDVLLPEVNLAFTFPSRETDRGAKVIEVMQYMCAARKIQLIEVRKKEPIELAHEIKQAFAKAHLYIDSDSEKEIDYLRKWYFHQTV